ncbi:M23 family metallopeptidase [Spirosoma areae]
MGREAIALLLIAIAFVALWLRKSKLSWPLTGTITSPFGNRVAPTAGASTFHNGIDISAKEGTPVLAPAAGTVTSLYTTKEGGNQLVIKHANGLTTGYAHLSSYAVKINQSVAKGQLMAYSGKTGNVTGPHLHFTVRNELGNYVNPLNYLT